MEATKHGVKLSVSPSVRATFSEEGAVLLDIEKGVCYSLNAVGAKVWQLLEADRGNSSFKDIVDVLALQFHIPHEQLISDIKAYLFDLSKKGLVTSNGTARHTKAF